MIFLSPARECSLGEGKVRLDAFEKFLQELPLSRSHTVVSHELFEDHGHSGTVSMSEVHECRLKDIEKMSRQDENSQF